MSASDTARAQALARNSFLYAAAAAAVLTPEASAQIVYTNPEPDVLVQDTYLSTTPPTAPSGIPFDFTGNGDPEIQIGEREATGGNGLYPLAVFDTDDAGLPIGDYVSSIVGNIVPFGGVDYLYFLPLQAGDTVGPDNVFEGEALGFGIATFTFTGSDPNANAGLEQFVGLEVTLATGTVHYAWMRFEIPDAGGQITIKDYAIETTPNTPIVAGNGVASEPDALAEGYRFSPLAPNPTTGTSTFEVAVGEAEAVRVEAFDALGRSVAVLHDGLLAAGQTRRLALDAAALPAGVYVVRVTGESFVTTRRVTVAR